MVIDLDLRRAAERFIGTLDARGYSPHTMAGYRKDVRRLLGLLAPPPGGPRPEDWTRDRLEAAFTLLARRGTSAGALTRTLAAGRFFERWCVEQGLLLEAPLRSITLRLTVDLEPERPPVERFLRGLEEHGEGDAEARRQRAVIELLAVPGVGADGLARLRGSDLDPSGRTLTLRAGGAPARLAELPKRVAQSLAAHRGSVGPTGWLVAGRDLQPMSPGRVHRMVRGALEAVARRAGLRVGEALECLIEWCARAGVDAGEVRRAAGFLDRASAPRRGPAFRRDRPPRPGAGVGARPREDALLPR